MPDEHTARICATLLHAVPTRTFVGRPRGECARLHHTTPCRAVPRRQNTRLLLPARCAPHCALTRQPVPLAQGGSVSAARRRRKPRAGPRAAAPARALIRPCRPQGRAGPLPPSPPPAIFLSWARRAACSPPHPLEWLGGGWPAPGFAGALPELSTLRVHGRRGQHSNSARGVVVSCSLHSPPRPTFHVASSVPTAPRGPGCAGAPHPRVPRKPPCRRPSARSQWASPQLQRYSSSGEGGAGGTPPCALNPVPIAPTPLYCPTPRPLSVEVGRGAAQEALEH